MAGGYAADMTPIPEAAGSAAEPRPDAGQRGSTALATALSGLVALAVAMGIGRFAFTPLLPMMQADGGLTVAEGGLLAAANYLGYLVGALCAARIHLAPGKLIRSGLAAICVTTLLMAVMASFSMWLTLRFAAGAASALVLIHVTAWSLERLAALNHPQAGGMVFSGVGTGIAAAGLICLGAMHGGINAAWSWVLLGIVAGIGLAAIWPSFAARGAEAPHAGTVIEHGAAAPSNWIWVGCYGVFGFGYIIPATFLPAMARQALPDPALFGWVWPVFGVAAALSTLLAARLVPVWGSRKLWAASHLVMAVGVVLPLLAPGLTGLLVSALLVGGTFMVATMAGMQHARAVAGMQQARGATRLIAAMTAAFATGQVIGPLVVSALKAQPDGGLALALGGSGVLLALSAIVLFAFRATSVLPR